MPNTRWFVRAIGIFLALLMVWIASAFILSVASASGTPFSMGLASDLAADYGQEQTGISFGPIKFSIIHEALVDLGVETDRAKEKAEDYLFGLDDPVPTATAVNFSGDLPHTPTATDPPSQISTPSPTPTDPPLILKTPVKLQATSTKIVEATPKSTSAATLGPCCDTVRPTLSGGSLSPPLGPLSSCEVGVTISGLRVLDPAPSSGIEWVKVKYKVEGPESRGYVYSGDLSPPMIGGWSGSAWDAVYAGSFDIVFERGYSSLWGGRKVLALVVGETATPTPETPTATFTPVTPTATFTPVTPTATHTPATPTETPESTPYTVKVWAGARDEEGNEGYLYLGSYSMPAYCD